jgi:hypothetical protein
MSQLANMCRDIWLNNRRGSIVGAANACDLTIFELQEANPIEFKRRNMSGM